MTPCDDCQAARETNGLWRRFNNRGCIYCAARLIQRARALPLTNAEIKARQTASLADSVDAGHSEKQIRKLVDGPLPLEPLPEKEKKK